MKVIDNLLFRDLEISGKVQENEQFLKTSSINSKILKIYLNGEDVEPNNIQILENYNCI